MCLTGFVFAMFFHRFIKQEKPNIGCLRALGFKNSEIREETVKKITLNTFMIGIFVPMILFCIITFGMYFMILKKEVALLIFGGDEVAKCSKMLRVANGVAEFFPEDKRMSVRLALRKPIPVALIITAVMTFSIMFLLAYSLNQSSGVVFQSQTQGRSYDNTVIFEELKCMGDGESKEQSENLIQRFLDTSGNIQHADQEISQTICGMELDKEMFQLMDEKGNPISIVKEDEIIIGKSLQEVYGLEVGDKITLKIEDKEHELIISAVAFNADMNCCYVDMQMLAGWMNQPEGTYIGLWSGQDDVLHGNITTWQEKIEALQRDSVSNRTSAVINQVIGVLIGSILLFLALSLNFQDSTRDMVILKMIGYKQKETRRPAMKSQP